MTAAAHVARLEAALRALLPTDAIGAAVDAFAVDGLTPALAVSPTTAADVCASLAAATAAGAAVIAWGGGTHMQLGMPPARYDLALDLRRLDRLVEYEPADLTVTVEAGTRLTELQRRLGEKGQWLPLDPPEAAAATIGGLLASNASGPAGVSHGTARDHLIGLSVAASDGALVKAGGRVVKNVAGYDLAKLHIGALGGLGVIVQASFKVASLPASSVTSLIRASLSDLMSITTRLLDARLSLGALTLRKDAADANWRLLIRLSGGGAAVERSRRDLDAIAAGASLEDADETPLEPPSPLSAAVAVRAGVPPSAAAPVCEAIATRGAAVYAYPSVGLVHGAWPDAAAIPPEALTELRALCLTADGALVLTAAPPDLKRRVDVWGPPRPDFEIMRRLKAQLDPASTLSPGRFLGGL